MKARFLLNFIVLLIVNVKGQNSSGDQNGFLGTNGTNCSAYGSGALFGGNSGPENTAAGHSALFSNTGGEYNTAIGKEALFFNTNGSFNTAAGYRALYNNNTGVHNTAVGCNALCFNDGSENTAHGVQALYFNISGNNNTAIGFSALAMNTIGNDNTASGYAALYNNVDGSQNTATGSGALFLNTSGINNTALGFSALNKNNYSGGSGLYGSENTAIGHSALHENVDGIKNVAVGVSCLYDNQDGLSNTAFGFNSMRSNQSGVLNIALGTNALFNNLSGHNNIAIGYYALYGTTTQNGNTAIGSGALANATGDENTAIGNGSGANAGAYTTCLGPLAATTGFFSNASAIGYSALVDNNDKIWLGGATIDIESYMGVIQSSDGRFKYNVKQEDVIGLDFIKLLRPVAYNFDTKKLTEYLIQDFKDSLKEKYLDQDFTRSTNKRQNGFIAQEVERAAEQVGYNFNAVQKPKSEKGHYALSYNLFVVPLVKAVQEQQKMLEEQKLQSKKLQYELEVQEKIITDLMKEDNISNLQSNDTHTEFNMLQNNPNPFNNETVINYTFLENVKSGFVVITDLTGKNIISYDLKEMGTSSITINAEKLESGIYNYTIIGNGKIMDTKTMVIVK